MLGNYNGFPGSMRTVAEAVTAKVGVGVRVSVGKTCELSGPGPVWLGDMAIWSRQAAVNIVVVGYSALIEGEEGCAKEEGGDRARYALPEIQMDLLRQIQATGRPLVVVVMAGSPVDLSWIRENADAVLFAWYPGAMGGDAVADVLFGDFSPAGRLPITFPVSYDQLPPFEDYALKGRTYRFLEQPPQYRFGYGLSYTRFEYRKLTLDRNTIGPGQSVKVSVEVRNAGLRAGDEVVQLYVSDLEASVPIPRQHLEGFRRIHLKPGRKKTVRFTLRPAQLAAYDNAGRPFVEPGAFRISVGGGQPDDPASGAKSRVLTVR
jgi:beta-glucosidase